MLVGREVANLDGIERPPPLLPRPPRQRQAKRPRKHRRVEGQHSGAPGHARSVHFSMRNPGTSAKSRSRSEEHTSELQSLMRISYDVFCLKTKKQTIHSHT